jgi:hypothetical protein
MHCFLMHCCFCRRRICPTSASTIWSILDQATRCTRCLKYLRRFSKMLSAKVPICFSFFICQPKTCQKKERHVRPAFCHAGFGKGQTDGQTDRQPIIRWPGPRAGGPSVPFLLVSRLLFRAEETNTQHTKLTAADTPLIETSPRSIGIARVASVLKRIHRRGAAPRWRLRMAHLSPVLDAAHCFGSITTAAGIAHRTCRF